MVGFRARCGLLLFLLALTACSANGRDEAEKDHSDETGDRAASFDECLGRGNGGDFHTIQCVEEEQKRVDLRLEGEIRRIADRLPRSGQMLLNGEQGRWSANLYSYCLADLRNSWNDASGVRSDSFLPPEDADIYEYGTQGMLIFNWCRLDETEDRIRELKQSYGDR